MDILKRPLAPITDEAWEEIDHQARMVLKELLASRRYLDVKGPHGFDYPAASRGRLHIPGKQPQGPVRYGLYKINPLVEARAVFELDLWELDNLSRGAKDVDLDPLIAAARDIAGFEEAAILTGFVDGEIDGLRQSAALEPVAFGGGVKDLMPALAEALRHLHNASIGGPYAFVVPLDLWKSLNASIDGRPLVHHAQYVLDGPVILNTFLDQPFVISLRGGDSELVLGADLSVGYESHDSGKVRLFFTESFTFRVLEPRSYVFLG